MSFPDVDYNSIPSDMKKEGADWLAVFNPRMDRVLDVNLVHTLMHESVVCCVRFSADGKYLATGCNRTAQIYDVRTGTKLALFADNPAGQSADLYIRSICFSPDGKLLATGADDKKIRVWVISKKVIRNVFEGHQQDVYSLDFSPDGRFIVSGSGDKTIRIWDMRDGTSKVLSDPDNDEGITSVAFSPNGRWVAAATLDTVVRIWDVEKGVLVGKLRGHTDSVYTVAFTPNGKGLLTGSLDKTLKYWDISGLGIIRGSIGNSPCELTFVGHKDYVLSGAVSSDGKWIVSGSKDRGVHFWDPHSATVQCRLEGHKNSVISVALSPAGNVLATGSGDWQAKIWRYDQI